jgi:hypothetical protein
MPKVTLSSCGLEVAVTELLLRSNISLKVAELHLRKCFLQVAEVLPAGCGIVIAD